MHSKTILLRAARLSALALLCSGLLACDAQSVQRSGLQRSPGQTSGAARTLPITDPALNMVAATVHVPAGWGFAGTVVHPGPCAIFTDGLQYTAESPDGSTGMVFLPVIAAGASTDPKVNAQLQQQGCIVFKSMRAADFVQQIILPHLRPGARILSVGNDPSLAPTLGRLRQLAAQSEQQNPVHSQYMDVQPTVVDSAAVRIAYQRNGRNEEEIVTAMTSCQVTRYPIENRSTLQCYAPATFAVHAPAGQLEAATATLSGINPNENPAWVQQIARIRQNQADQLHQQQRQQLIASGRQNQANLNAQFARGQAINNSINERGQQIVASGHASQNAIDQASKATALSLNDHNDFSNGSGTTFTGLSNQYNHTYDNGQGTVLQTNSAYAPGPSSIWTELTPKY